MIIIIFLVVLNVAGLSGISKAIFATAGASAVVIGFAFKDIAQNFLAGIILAFNRPFNIGDTIQVEDVFGKVLEMEFRYTCMATFDGKDVYIPNSDVLTKPVYNYTQNGYFRTDFVLGIAYENDAKEAKEAKKLIQQCLDQDKEVVHDEQHINFAVEDEVAPSTVNLRIYIWIETKDFRRHMLEVRGRVITRAQRRFWKVTAITSQPIFQNLNFMMPLVPFKSITTDWNISGKIKNPLPKMQGKGSSILGLNLKHKTIMAYASFLSRFCNNEVSFWPKLTLAFYGR